MKVLMVYYSRTGVTKKTTEKIAELLREKAVEVEVVEIVEAKKRTGVLGCLRTGKDAMRRHAAPIEPVKADPAAFDLVAIGTPVWAWSVSAPVRTFCQERGKDAQKLAFYCTMGGTGDKGTFEAMQELCGKAPVATLALIDRHVRKDHEEKFVAKARTFAEAIASTGG